MIIRPPLFNYDEASRAHDVWGANCGPGALAAICLRTLDDVRRHMGDFERKGHTTPTLMFAALKSLGIRYMSCRFGYWSEGGVRTFPRYGLCRVQWEGPWMKPGVPLRARYRHTHWIGAATKTADNIGVFDINCMNNGNGWVSLDNWRNIVVPYIVKECVPRGDGGWHLTHAIEVELPS